SANSALNLNQDDFLYHFGLSRTSVDLEKIFGDTKFVCCGGSPTRFEHYANEFSKDSGLPLSANLSRSDRFVIYKTGPVLWINHGMGAPSLSIMMVETLKLIHYARATDVTFIRLGTSGGVGVAPGSVVVTNAPVNGELNEEHVQWIAGKKVVREARLDKRLQQDLIAMGEELSLPVVSGKTLCADDFYEGQMRLDGYFCDYTSTDKFAFLRQLHEMGVRNIEMESTCFSSFTARAGIPAAIVCVTLLNRMDGDQVTLTKEEYLDFETRPFKLVSAFIKQQLSI
ncbi:hypothetical protein PFISCL1PPCAC_10212, partial [Pristionchus fissidentatus]